MWQDAYRICTNQVVVGLLTRPVLPARLDAFERVSATIAVRAALYARQSPRTLMFLVPQGTARTARCITAGLLIGSYAHEHGDRVLPACEVRRLLKGDVLLVTPAVSECKEDLDQLQVDTYTRLSDVWETIPLSRYNKAKGGRSRVFIANPGWALTSASAGRRFAAVVIDATHPRTLSRLQALLGTASGCSDLRIVVCPPLSAPALEALGHPQRADVWLWDPQAKLDANEAVDERPREVLSGPERTLWVSDDDPEADEALAAAYRCLTDIAKRSAGRSYPGLAQAWSIVNRLRQLTVGLTRVEHDGFETWGGTIKQRLQRLDEVAGYGDAVWDSTWPQLRKCVEQAYQTFLKRDETAKFWALATRLEELLQDKQSGPYRLVVPTNLETTALTSALSEVVDRLPEALLDGTLQVISASEEARKVGEGDYAHTLLLGARSSTNRYLDAFPDRPLEEFLYPFEVRHEQLALSRQAETLGALQDERRTQLLLALGLKLPENKERTARAPLMVRVAVRTASGRAPTIVRAAEVEAKLDLDELASTGAPTELRGDGGFHVAVSRSGNFIDVDFFDGTQLRYSTEQHVDVFFPATEDIKRYPVTELKEGWHVITMVDGEYDSLFNRMTQAISSRLDSKEQMALALWDQAKEKLVREHPNRRVFWEKLRTEGLETSYGTFCTWMRDDDDVVAPQQFDDFIVLARASRAFPSEGLMRQTFESIQHMRGRNRTAGRKLQALLRAIIVQSGYEDALESARKVDPELADVFAAVDVREVKAVKSVARSNP